MMAEALADSPTLAQAAARLREAQEELNARTGATKYPTVTGNAAVEQEQPNLSAYGIPFPNPSPFTLLNGSVAVSYALDIFGANRRLIEGLQAERDYENWQLEGARLMLAGNVASAAIRQAQLRKQIELTMQLLAVEQRELAIAEARKQAGGASDADVESQKALVAETQATIPPLEAQLDGVDHQLAVLMGKSPAEAQIPDLSLDVLHLPQELPLSLPSALVRQRPDIRASEALLHEASANVGVATANLYPQIVLSGSGGGTGTSFVAGGDVWNVASSLMQPIYNGGALRAEKRKAEAAYQEASSVYRQTVLQAFGQVADTLTAIDHDAQTLKARSDAAADADASYQIAFAALSGGRNQRIGSAGGAAAAVAGGTGPHCRHGGTLLRFGHALSGARWRVVEYRAGLDTRSKSAGQRAIGWLGRLSRSRPTLNAIRAVRIVHPAITHSPVPHPPTPSRIFHAKCSNAAGCAAASQQSLSIDVFRGKILAAKGFCHALLHVADFLSQNANAAGIRAVPQLL